ncbi:MAG TPA: hypothetical protein ENH82_19175 [bacterium]|nr:hypothetical protein [bacterium]
MKCQICNKNIANIVFTQILNNEKMVLQICTECAKEKGISVEIEKPSKPKVDSFIGSFTGIISEKDEKEVPDLTCAVCGLTFAEFKKSGLFGCDKCHEAFGEHVSNLLKQIHGTDVYEGELPDKLSEEGETMQKLKKLRSELKHCIGTEDYERAAELRDRIAEIEEKN